MQTLARCSMHMNSPIALRELVSDRKTADALTRGSEDRVTQSGRKWRQAGLPNSCGRHIDAVRHDVHIRHLRSFIDAHELVVVEIPLLDAAGLAGNRAIFGKREPHDRTAL